MKIRILFKTPDVIDRGLENLDVDDDTKDEIRTTMEKWVRDNEYITLEIDTLNKTCVPIPVR